MPAAYEQNVVDVLEACVAVEEAAAKLYELLADLQSEDTEISALWMKMAREEHSHAAQFKLALGNAGAMVANVATDLGRTDELRRQVLELAERYRASPPTVIEALTAAAGFEEDLATMHMDRVALFTQESYRALFKAMMAADKDHVGGLTKALRRRGVRR